MIDKVRDEDIALGIVNMVFQVIGVLAAFAAKNSSNNIVILTGNAINKEVGEKVFSQISEMYNVEFVYPENPEYVTAIGAAFSIK